MSKIGKKPISLPDGVEVKQENNQLRIKGGKGEQVVTIPTGVSVSLSDKEVTFALEAEGKQARSNWGTVASLTENAVEGVANGYEKTLEIEGVGYKVAQDGKGLTLNLGFSHPVKFPAPEGIELTAPDQNTIVIKGIDKQAVGQVAAEIRKIRKPEPYKGKGVRYKGEYIRRKAGKKVGSE